MSTFTLSGTVAKPYAETLDAVREALSDVGFGVLTEIDLAATMRSKLGLAMPPQTILGACRPALAYEALRAEPAVAAVLPCNVVVRADDETTTVVEVFDPAIMVGLAGRPLEEVALDARRRLTTMLETVTEEEPCSSIPVN